MNFTPKTEEQINEEGLLPKGTYDFEVLEAKDTTSKNGNEMIWLKLGVFDANGNSRHVYDYLLEALAYKLRHAAVTCGLEEQYNEGSLNAGHFLNRSGRCKIDIEKGGEYPSKNVVRDYDTEGKVQNGAVAPQEPALNDEIPF